MGLLEKLNNLNGEQNNQDQKELYGLELRKGEYEVIKSFTPSYTDITPNNEIKKGELFTVLGYDKHQVVLKKIGLDLRNPLPYSFLIKRSEFNRNLIKK